MNSGHELYQSLGSQCDGCPLSDCEGPVPFKVKKEDPPYDFDISFVAERPAATELGKGEPLAGRSGWILEKMLREFNVWRKHVHLTNATPCTVYHAFPEKDWTNAIDRCRERLANELSGSRRQLVFLLGSKSLQAVTGKSSIKAWRGYPIAPLPEFDSDKTTYFPTYHPSHILREAAFLPVWKLDFQRAFAYMRGRLRLWKWPPLFVDDNEDTAEQLVRLIHEVEKRPTDIGLDVETAGKEPLLVPLLCIGAATREYAISLPHQSQFPENRTNWKYLLNHRNCRIVTQNGNHDLLSLNAHGYPTNEINFDTLVASRIRYARIDKDLGTLATLFYFIERHKSQYRKGGEDTKGEAGWAKQAADPEKFRKLRVYNAQDAYTTVMIREPLERLLAA